MKLVVLFLLTAMLHVCRPVLSQRVSISGSGLTLEQIFKEINQQTGIEFFYQSSLLKDARPVNLHVQAVSVEEVLKSCLKDQGLGYTLRSSTIVIFKQDEPVQHPPPGGKQSL